MEVEAAGGQGVVWTAGSGMIDRDYQECILAIVRTTAIVCVLNLLIHIIASL